MSDKNNNKENEMDKLFFKLLEQKKLEIKWHRNASLLRASNDLKEEINKNSHDIEEKEFIHEAFRISNIMRDVAIGEKISDRDKNKIDIVENYLTENPELKNQIIIKTMSNLNSFDGINYEILTKRSKKDVKKILTYSALLNISYCSLSDDEKDSYNNVVIELTKEDIEKTVTDLKNILDTMNEVGD